MPIGNLRTSPLILTSVSAEGPPRQVSSQNQLAGGTSGFNTHQQQVDIDSDSAANLADLEVKLTFNIAAQPLLS